MIRNKSCFRCITKNDQSSSKSDTAEELTPTFDKVRSIWRKKMEKSQLFLPLEIDVILSIWIKFVCDRIKCLPYADVEEFYVETAELAALNFKHYPNHGWECLIKEFPIDIPPCSQESLQPQGEELPTKERQKDNEVERSSSAESICDVLGQVEFLMELVASSNFNLNLVKTALDPSFEPTYIEMKFPHVFILPKNYLELEFDNIEKAEIRKNLLNGVYNEYILPLQIANDVDDEFWIDENCGSSSHSNF